MNETKFSVYNYKGCTVSCSKERWETHIAQHHKIMDNNIAAVKDTIKDPDSVYESTEYPNREVYFKSSTFSSYKDFKTKVIVEYSPGVKNPDTVVGSVVTTFPVKGETGGIGNAVYKKSSD